MRSNPGAILIEQSQPFFSVFLVEFHESAECAGADIVIQTDLLDCLLPDQPSRDHMEDEEYTVNAVRDQERCKDCMRRITCIALDPADLHVLPIDDLSIYNVVQGSGIETMITVLSVFSAFRTGFFADGCILCYVLDDIKRVLFYLINLAKLIEFD